MMRQFNIIVIILFLSLSGAYAACTSPAGAVGSMQYVSAASEFKFCDDSSTWVSMSADNTAGAACSTPGLLLGDKYCNGSFFYSMVSQNLEGGACSPEKSYKYFSNSMHVCSGGSYNIAGFCTNCFSGHVYTCPEYTKMIQCISDTSCEWNGACVDVAGYEPPADNGS